MGMLRDEVRLFEKLSGESANDVTIERLGSFLDGYFVGKEESVVHAHWTVKQMKDNLFELDAFSIVCSNCKHKSSRESRYCPECGALMDEKLELDIK